MRKIKNLFSTPKRTTVSIAVIVAALGILGTGTTLGIRAAVKSNAIGSTSAEQIALADAGAEVAEARLQQTEFSYEDGRFVYEVEFYTDLGEYEYTIAANSGDILWREWDLHDTAELSAISIFATTTTVDTTKETTITTTAKTERKTTTTTTNCTTTTAATVNTTTIVQISLEDAKAIVLADAGVANADVSFTKERLGKEDGVLVYDLEFYTTEVEYDYEIYAETGEIVSKEVDILQNTSENNEGTETIELETVKDMVLNDAGISSSDAVFTKEKLDQEHGVFIYDLEFYTAEAEYDYEINAETGEIVQKEVEPIFSDNANGDYIGIDAAKEIALQNAGISANSAIFTKAKLEKEDGMMVYEIEFICDKIEYEYTIQAIDGAILEYDIDHD